MQRAIQLSCIILALLVWDVKAVPIPPCSVSCMEDLLIVVESNPIEPLALVVAIANVRSWLFEGNECVIEPGWTPELADAVTTFCYVLGMPINPRLDTSPIIWDLVSNVANEVTIEEPFPFRGEEDR